MNDDLGPPIPGYESLWRMAVSATDTERRAARLRIAYGGFPDVHAGRTGIPPIERSTTPARSLYAPQTIPLDETMRLNARMGECPFRTSATDCGCGGMARCTFPWRRRLVNHQDCYTCLQGAESQRAT